MRGTALGLTMLCSVAAIASAQDQPGSYLVRHVKAPDGQYSSKTVPYEPNAGDLVFFNDYKPHWMKLYKLVGSEGPYHAALVYRKANGEYATVEAGPDDTLHCRVLPLTTRLQDFAGTIHLRRVKTPIGPPCQAPGAQATSMLVC